jgi:hypothetical protein
VLVIGLVAEGERDMGWGRRGFRYLNANAKACFHLESEKRNRPEGQTNYTRILDAAHISAFHQAATEKRRKWWNNG